VASIEEKNAQITQVLKRTMEAIAEGKKDIFEISETARNDYNNLKKELEDFQDKVQILIKEVEILEHQEKMSRKILLTVSKNFSRHTEEDIKIDQRPITKRPSPKNKLSQEERVEIIKTINSPEFADLAPSQIVPKLANEGKYLASESTIYRILKEENLEKMKIQVISLYLMDLNILFLS